MRKVKSILLAALLVGIICISGCSSSESSTSNASQNVSAESSVADSSVEESSIAESSIEESSVAESSVTESSVVSQESMEFTEDIATEKLKTAILSKYPDAVFGEVEIVVPIGDNYYTEEHRVNRDTCKIGIKGHATITDSYGHSVNKDFNYCADVLIMEEGIYVHPSSKFIGKYYGGRESLPKECEGYY